ncbi:MAG: hypothetical protein Q9160_001687 [Pyrenula sp. 1 TL-2023]
MAEPPLKKPKPSTSGLSAFAATTSRRKFQTGDDNKSNTKSANAKAQIKDDRASSVVYDPANRRLDPQMQTLRNHAPRFQKSEECPPKAFYSLRPAEHDIRRLRTLLFPRLSDSTGNGDIPPEVSDRGIENTAELYDSFGHQTRWRSGQERAAGEIFSFSENIHSSKSRTDRDTDGTKTRPKPFVRATADLVCATLSDRTSESTLEWEIFFRSLHTTSAIPSENEAFYEVGSEDAITYVGESTKDAGETHHISTTNDKDQVERARLSSQLFTARATYAMAWIRFVNAFADRDVRNSKISRQAAVPSTQNTAQQEPISHPHQEEEYVTATHSKSLPTVTEATSQNRSSESSPSFLSLNPYDVLSLPKVEESAPSLPNLDSLEPSADQSGNKRTRNEGTMYAQANLIDMPLEFVDVRHQCVHDEDMPPLHGEMGLKITVKKGLRWVWERHWKDLDVVAT